MRERVAALVGGRARLMTVSTFHSACVRILRREAQRFGFSSSFSIYDDADSRRLMTLVCRDLELDPKRYPPRAVQHWVSNQKNELRNPEEAARRAENDVERSYADAYARYQSRLTEANALDFDDLIMTTVRLFQAFPDVREAYRRRYRHVLVDEYQDTNHAQYVLVRELCAPDPGPGRCRRRSRGGSVGPGELMVVGDSDQSIYAFRGANIRNILEFEHDFPERAHGAAGAELPLDPGHPHRRQRGDRAQLPAQRQAAVDRRRCGRPAGRVRRRRRARRGAVHRRRDRPAARRGRGQAERRGGVLPHQRPEPGVRGGVHPGRPAVQGRRRAAVLRAPRGQGRAGLPAHADQPARHGLAAPHPQHPQARHRRACRGVRGRAGRAGADRLLRGAAPGRGGAGHRDPLGDGRARRSSR